MPTDLSPGPRAVEVEIREIPPVSPAERSLIDAHSVLNIVTVLQLSLELIGIRVASDANLLTGALATCRRIVAGLTTPALVLEAAGRVAEFKREILDEIDAVCVRHQVVQEQAGVRELRENIQSIFHILALRAQEILARAREPDVWLEFKIEDLQQDFREIFAAIEKNSGGRYHIIYNLAQQLPQDYYIAFNVESANRRTVWLPLVFKDVMRDLIANSRKYTKPGGEIHVGLYETERELRFVVADTGCGIPPDEIERVVHSGYRASNVQGTRTMGGGFGLTKAFLVTQRFGGRMVIRSTLDRGTRVTLTLPRPEQK